MVAIRRCLAQDKSGQATVEYAVLLVAFLMVVVGLGAIWRASSTGKLLELAQESCSHSFQASPDLNAWKDILLF